MRCKCSWPKQIFRLFTAFAVSTILTFCGFDGNLLPSSCLSLDYSLQLHFSLEHQLWREQAQSSVMTFPHVFNGRAGWKPQVSLCNLGLYSGEAFGGLNTNWELVHHEPAFPRTKRTALCLWSKLPMQSFVCAVLNYFGSTVPLLDPKASLLFQEETCLLQNMPSSVVQALKGFV